MAAKRKNVQNAALSMFHLFHLVFSIIAFHELSGIQVKPLSFNWDLDLQPIYD